MSNRPFFAACLLTALVAGHAGAESLALAQAAPEKAPHAAAAPSPAKQAEELAAKGYEQQAAGQYSDAIGSYLEAYKLSGAAVILFNVATIYDRKLHEDALAEDYYRRYLGAVDTEPELARKATSRLQELKQAAKDRAAASEVVPVPTSSPSAPPPAAAPAPAPAPAPLPAPAPATTGAEPGSTQRTIGIVLGAAGLATLGVSAGFSIFAKVRNSDANGFCNGSECTNQRGVDFARTAGDAASVATATFIGGAVMLAAGIGLYAFSPSSRRGGKSAKGATPELRMGASGAPALSGTF